MTRGFFFLRYLLVFLRELILANIQVTKLVLSPQLKIRPGFLSVPMEAQSDFEVTSLANSITLTPGTISVHVPEDRHVIVIHVLDIGEDADRVRRNVKQMLEVNILKWTRSKNAAPGDQQCPNSE